jgi:hypothetical protein
MSRWMSAPQGLSTEEQMTCGLDFLLDGIDRRITATRPAGTPQPSNVEPTAPRRDEL